MGQTFDQAKHDDTFLPIPNILTGSVWSFQGPKLTTVNQCYIYSTVLGAANNCGHYTCKKCKNYIEYMFAVYLIILSITEIDYRGKPQIGK